MIPTIQILVVLLAVIAVVAVVSARLKIPSAILLVLTGVVLALVPDLPTVELAPTLVLLLVLPPVIYSSAVAMSWREFRFNLRPISLLAVGCVAFTTVAIAAATHWLLGFGWPVGFVVGAIVSPPDAVAPLSIARKSADPQAYPRHPRRGRTGQRCHRAHSLPLCGSRCEPRNIFIRPGRRHVCGYCRRRDSLGNRCGFGDAAFAALGQRPALRSRYRS